MTTAYSIQDSFFKKQTNIISKNRLLFGRLFCVFLCLLFTISKTTGSEAIIYIATVFFFLYFIIEDVEVSLITLCMFCPNTYYVSINQMALFGFALIIIFIKLTVSTRKTISYRLVISGLFLVLAALPGQLLFDDSVIMGLIKISLIIICISSIICSQKSDIAYKTVRELEKAFVTGTLLCCLLGVTYNFACEIPIMANAINRFKGLANDPNYLGSTIIFAISLIPLLLFDTKQKNCKRIIWGLSFVFLFAIGILTLSRVFILTFLLLFSIFLLFFIFDRRKRLLSKIFLLTFFLCLSFLAYVCFYDTIQSLFERFFADTFSTGSGRYDIWLWYLKSAVRSPLSVIFGNGTPAIAINEGFVTHNPHNTLIEIFYDVGFVGFIAFLYLIFVFSKSVISNTETKIKAYALFPLVAVILPYFFLSSFTGELFILGLVLSILIFKIDRISISSAT